MNAKPICQTIGDTLIFSLQKKLDLAIVAFFNYKLIRIKIFVSQIIHKLYN
jgi:hypothetical protein